MIEHPLEFELGHLGFNAADVVSYRAQRVVVAFGFRQLEQLGAVLQMAVDVAQVDDDAFEQLLLAAQLLRVLLVVPDLGVFELPRDLGQPCRFGIEVKDTSAARPRARTATRGYCRSG